MFSKITVSHVLNALLIALGIYVLGRHIYLRPQFGKSEVAPEITATLSNGEAFHLSDLRGKYVLLDFWGSWCGLCRKDNPELVKLYQMYNTQTFQDASGFEIVSIGIEADRRRWFSAISNDNLSWSYHISDFQNFESPIAQLYGVRKIPTKYLLDKNGIIIGVNQSAKEIDRFLARQLNN